MQSPLQLILRIVLSPNSFACADRFLLDADEVYVSVPVPSLVKTVAILAELPRQVEYAGPGRKSA